LNCGECPLKEECTKVNEGQERQLCLIMWAVSRTAAAAMADVLREEMSLGSEYSSAIKSFKKLLLRILQNVKPEKGLGRGERSK